MMVENRIARLQLAVTNLLYAYREAKRQSDPQEIITRAAVTRSIIDSARALVNRMRTREHGVEKLVEEVEKYYQALRPEDWVERSSGAAAMTASILGITITAGAIVGLALKLVFFCLQEAPLLAMHWCAL
jgi:hypothetical protein